MARDVKLIKKDDTQALQSVHFVKDSEKEAFCKWINQSVFGPSYFDLPKRP
jgi:hypothetical protein